jgi:hypothetical protein
MVSKGNNPKEASTGKKMGKEGVSTEKVAKKLGIEPERAQFRALILANPNYFGNIKVSRFKPVKAMELNASYEEIKCVGFNPRFNRLEAVVWIKQDSGYGGGICSDGAPEYVRFYLSFDNGATWQDQGMASFNAYDIPGEKPLEYAVTLQIDPEKMLCFTENLPLVRAILAYNYPPPPDTPDHHPPYGNVKEAHIQIDPLWERATAELFMAADIVLPPEFEEVFDLAQPLVAAQPKILNPVELYELYQDKGVPEHRFLFGHIQELIAKPILAQSLAQTGLKGLLPDYDLDFPKIIEQLQETEGDTRYEELRCIGLNSDQDTLVGILDVKLPYGYSGGLCSAGSYEYVAFWVDWEDGAGWTYVGTTSVNVHDLSTIPPEGLHYSVFLPVNFTSHRRPCQEGAVTAKVRAVLSWQDRPPPDDPYHPPRWGNAKETLIHLRPGPKVSPETHPPFIETVGNMAVTSIDATTGLANGPAVGVGIEAIDSPFGGEVVITGHIAYPPDVLGDGADRLKYKVSVSDDGGSTWQLVNNKFKIWRTRLIDGIWSGPAAYTQQPDEEGWYEYHEDLTGNTQQFVAQNVLARWQTGGLSGLWQIKIQATDPAVSGSLWPSNVVTIRLDNQAPVPSVTITSGAGPCGDFLVGDTISGEYSVTDEHFGVLRLSVQPALGGEFTSPAPILGTGMLMPLERHYAPPVVPTMGDGGTWTLDTSGMPRCGYVIYLEVWDRTIVNSGRIGYGRRDVVGFCLREPDDS